MTIISGTTPTIEYTFTEVDPTEIAVAILSIKQNGTTVIERDLTTATVEESKITWSLSQAETLSLTVAIPTILYLDYRLTDGTRGAGVTTSATVLPSGKKEVI